MSKLSQKDTLSRQNLASLNELSNIRTSLNASNASQIVYTLKLT